MTIEANGPGASALGTADRAAVVAAISGVARVSQPDEAALLGTLADTAFGLAEQFLDKALIVRACRERLPVVTGWQRIGISPVRSITAVAGLAADGTPTVLPIVGYEIDIDARGDGWVRIKDAGGASRVEVTMSAGIAEDWSGVPAPVRQGIAMLGAYLFGERGPALPPPGAITALWRPFRSVAIGARQHA